MSARTEILSPSEAEVLMEHVRSANEVSSTTLKVLPVVLIVTVLCWYYDWYGILKFVFTLTSVAFIVSLVSMYFKNRKINSDLKTNHKKIEVFFLKKRFVEGYVKEAGESGNRVTGRTKSWADSIILADESIRHAITYKQRIKTANKLERMMMQSDIEDAVLSYTYKYKLIDRMGNELQMEVPIELYLEAMEGKDTEIAYAPDSKIVFRVRELK